MKKIFLLFVSLLSGLNIQAQHNNGCLSNNHLKYFNGFQHTKTNPQKLAVAISHAQNLAKACPPSLRGLFHTFYAQSFSKRILNGRSNTAERKLLDRLVQDTSQVITKTLQPIVLWVKVGESENNPAALIRVTDEFMATQLKANDWYENRVARYALLIYQLIHLKKEYAELAQTILSATITGLEKGMHSYELLGDAVHNQKRAWYRYLYAYSNLLQGEELKRKGEVVNAERYYRTAAEYSPDLLDKSFKPAYDYDMAFLIGADKSNGFKEEYLAFLETYPDKAQTLKILTSLAVADPSYLPKLQAFYLQHYLTQEPFQHYWEKELKKLPLAPTFSLMQLNKTNFSLEAHTGKWILLDFWGTWCEPCMKEMPQMQSFYREISSKYADRLRLLTIACRDTEVKVKTYLNKHTYHFPVAMADEGIEKEFSVAGYPTKILITPQGTMIPISAEENWVEQVKLYCGL